MIEKNGNSVVVKTLDKNEYVRNVTENNINVGEDSLKTVQIARKVQQTTTTTTQDTTNIDSEIVMTTTNPVKEMHKRQYCILLLDLFELRRLGRVRENHRG